jgi:ATP-dependent helicase/nuclease subunit A
VMPKSKKDGSDPRPARSWHVIVEQAMGTIASPGDGHIALHYGSVGAVPKRARDKPELAAMVVPQWAKQPAPPESRPPRPLAPSALGVDDETAPPPSEAMRAAALRGTWIHQLLERLPAVEADARPAVAKRWLERSAGLADRAVIDEIVAQVCGILSDPQFAGLFGPGSLAEAPLAATLDDGRVIAGTVDRILVEDTRVSVIDFKTGRVPPSDADIPNSHRRQMAAYAEALRVILPGRHVGAFLLYTAGPKLIQLTP